MTSQQLLLAGVNDSVVAMWADTALDEVRLWLNKHRIKDYELYWRYEDSMLPRAMITVKHSVVLIMYEPKWQTLWELSWEGSFHVQVYIQDKKLAAQKSRDPENRTPGDYI